MAAQAVLRRKLRGLGQGIPMSSMFLHEGAENLCFSAMARGTRTLDIPAYLEAYRDAMTREFLIQTQRGHVGNVGLAGAWIRRK